MRTLRIALSLSLATIAAAFPALGAQSNSRVQEQSVGPQGQEAGSLALMANRIVTREQQLIKQLRKYSPRAETYLQEFKPDPELGPVVSGDQYYIGRLRFDRGLKEATFHPETGFTGPFLHSIHNKILPIYGVRFNLSTPGILI